MVLTNHRPENVNFCGLALPRTKILPKKSPETAEVIRARNVCAAQVVEVKLQIITYRTVSK